MEWPTTVESWASIVSSCVAIFGFIAVIIQLHGMDRDLKSGARGSIYDMASRIKEVFLAKPHLRKYFSEGISIDSGHEHYEEVIAIADYYCLYLEQITTQQSNIDERERAAWLKYAHDIYWGSPAIQTYLTGKEKWYSGTFWNVINSAEMKHSSEQQHVNEEAGREETSCSR
jgi:hypothetical protein